MPTQPDSLHRKALAGMAMLAGKSRRQAALDAGYAPSTAAKPTQNGITEKRCIEAARELFPEAIPANLIRQARELGRRKMAKLLTSEQQLERTKLSEVARMVEVAERCYGGEPGDDIKPRAFVDRLQWLEDVAREMRERNAKPRTIAPTPNVTTSDDAIDVEAVAEPQHVVGES